MASVWGREGGGGAAGPGGRLRREAAAGGRGGLALPAARLPPPGLPRPRCPRGKSTPPAPVAAAREARKAARKVVIAGVPDGLLQEDVMADILTIHFQKARNNGGDVEEVEYPTRLKGVAYITFEDQKVVESVLKKDDHQLEDRRLSRHYPLRVTPYCENVFSSVTSVLNMSVFKEQFVLEELLQEIQGKSTALSFGPLQPDGHVAVQGSFPDIKLLRDFLLLKAKCLSEKDRRGESKSHQSPRRMLQDTQANRGLSSSAPDADGETQVVVLDADVYLYMKSFHPSTLQGGAGVVISAITDCDTTTLHIKSAGHGADVGQISRTREQIEDLSAKLYRALRKERIYLKESSRGEKERYQRLCGHLKARFPHVLVIEQDAHIDVIGEQAELLRFTRELSSTRQSW
ncbi:RNA-binding protein 43 [Dryobates pubescens]|uniref:RNA-binding protein 43 n=1 Tax=Dryobates pubescens TaxID=118200 RepID=UPI0023B91670|nr:RNA-binding protein 43 [Dryobates pubescens]